MRRLPILLFALLPLVSACAQAGNGFTAAPVSTSSRGVAASTAPSNVPAPTAVAAPTAPAAPTGGTSQPVGAPTTADSAVVLRVGQGTAADALVSVHAGSGRLLARLPVGVPDTTWSTVYAVAASGATTVVRAVDSRTGAELRRTEIAGAWALPVLVSAGLPEGLANTAGRLVLVDPAPETGVSRFAVLNTNLASVPAIIKLQGRFDFDAIGPDAHYLYLIEHIGGAGSGHYQVRAYDLFVGALTEGAIVDKREIDEEMEGRPVARVASGDGLWAYTVYVREDGTAFVHQLETIQAFALCVDLPETVRGITDADAAAWRIAASGATGAFVANGRLQFLAAIGNGEVKKAVRLGGSSVVELAARGPAEAYVLEPTVLSVFDGSLDLVGHGQSAEADVFALSPARDTLYLLAAGGRMSLVRTADWVTPAGGFTLDRTVDWGGAIIAGVTGE